MSELAKGFTCNCGKFNVYPVYVFAHWDEALDTKCECGKKWVVRRGIAIPARSPRKRVRK